MAVLDAVSVNLDVPEPGAAMGFGLKLPLTPDGMPVAESVIAELNPPETVVLTVTYPLFPRASELELGETEMVKAGAAGAVTVSETVVVSTVVPEVPVTVIG